MASSTALKNEYKILKKMSDIGLKNFLPDFYGDTFLKDIYSIKLEYISQSLEDHIKSLKG